MIPRGFLQPSPVMRQHHGSRSDLLLRPKTLNPHSSDPEILPTPPNKEVCRACRGDGRAVWPQDGGAERSNAMGDVAASTEWKALRIWTSGSLLMLLGAWG